MLVPPTKDFHLARSGATRVAASMVRSLLSFITVHLHDSFGRSLFRFPWGCPFKADPGQWVGGMRRTWLAIASVSFGWFVIFLLSLFFSRVLHLRLRLVKRSWVCVRGIWFGRLQFFFQLSYRIEPSVHCYWISWPWCKCWCCGFPNRFQNCKSLVCLPDPGVDFLCAVDRFGDFATQVCKLLSIVFSLADDKYWLIVGGIY